MLDELNLLTGGVIGSAIDAHRKLGPGLRESFYQNLMSAKLRERKIDHASKPRRPLIHRGHVADEFEVDLLFGLRLLADLKVLKEPFAGEHLAQLISYLKFWAIRLGLLLDFGKERVYAKRVIFDELPRAFPTLSDMLAGAPGVATKSGQARELCGRMLRIGNEYGFGYREKTYRGLFQADCAADQILCIANPVVEIAVDAESQGSTELACQVLPGQCAVLILALNASIRAADRAVLASYLRHLKLRWGLIANFGKTQFDFEFMVK